MFQPKKTIPKLVVGALALSGCGGAGGDVPNDLKRCLSELGPSAAELCQQMYGDAGNPNGEGYGYAGYGYGYGYGDNNGYGDNGGVVAPNNDPNPTNDPFLQGGDSFYGGGSYGGY